jgi:hypothetical protein
MVTKNCSAVQLDWLSIRSAACSMWPICTTTEFRLESSLVASHSQHSPTVYCGQVFHLEFIEAYGSYGSGLAVFHSSLERSIHVQISPCQWLRFPQDVAIIDSERLLIVDADSSCVIMLSVASNEVVVTIDTVSVGNKLGVVTAVAFAEGGTACGPRSPSIFIADAGEHCVHVCRCDDAVRINRFGLCRSAPLSQVFDLRGSWQYRIGSRGSAGSPASTTFQSAQFVSYSLRRAF